MILIFMGVASRFVFEADCASKQNEFGVCCEDQLGSRAWSTVVTLEFYKNQFNVLGGDQIPFELKEAWLQGSKYFVFRTTAVTLHANSK